MHPIETTIMFIMGLLHVVAGVAFSIDGDNVAAVLQLLGGLFWWVMISVKGYVRGIR